MLNNPRAILIVDDSDEEIMIVKRAIMKFRPDCLVETACDGPEALLRLQNGNTPAMILLDLKLPGMDGIDILRFIRGRQEIRYTPVVILTSSILDSDIRAAYDAGANGFLHKMLDIGLFAQSIRAALHYWLDFNRAPSHEDINRT
jgi:CheY-like chemotaxis protein